MTREIDNSITFPTRLGEYEILRELPGGRSYAAIDGAGRSVVLKRLAADCMLGVALHPHVRDRLLRVRELAHPGVANLIGVEATAWGSMLVWEFVEGKTLEELADELSSPADLSRLAEEVLLAVQSLHALGIVHGGLHGRNIIVDARRAVKLTHISPLLYDDPRQDAQDVAAALAAIAAGRGWDQQPWEKLRRDAVELGVAGMRRRLSRVMEERTGPPNRVAESRRRRRLLAGAVATATVGLAMAGGVIAYEVRTRPPMPVPPRIAPAAMPDQSDVPTDDAAADSTDSQPAENGDAGGGQ